MHAIALLAWCAVILGHGLSNGVISSGALGDRSVTKLVLAGAILSQLTVLLVPAVLLRQTLGGLLQATSARPLGWLSLPVAAGWVWLSLLSSAHLNRHIDGLWLLALGAGTVWVVADSCIQALRNPSTRAASLVGLAFCCVGAARIVSHLLVTLAERNLSADLYANARLAITLGWFFAVIAMGLALWWFWRSTGSLHRAAVVVLLACAPALVFAGGEASGYQVAIDRTLEQISVGPHPLVPAIAERWRVATALLLALCLGSLWRAPQGVPIALFLLAGLRLDVPIYNTLALLAGVHLLDLSQSGRFCAASEALGRFS